MSATSRDGFTNKFGVIAAAAGSAVGLGNIWRFPYVAGENGGGAFLLVYLLFIVMIGLPVMLSELLIGRRAQKSVFGAFRTLAPDKPLFMSVGIMGVGAAFMILAFYAVVAGWTMEYTYLAITDSLSGMTPSELSAFFSEFQSSTVGPLVWVGVFMILTAGIVIGGVKNGIEKYTKILMPLLLVIIIILSIKSVSLEGAQAGLAFLFKPDFSKLSGDVILEALGQAFFSLSIGMGVIATYGSYIQKKENLIHTAVSVSFADSLIAVLAGVAIFPAVFAFGIDPSSGPGLVFETLPNVFNSMQGGYIFSVAFFILLVIAALTSSVSLLEVVVAYFVEELGLTRKKATIIAASSISVLGAFCVLSDGAFKFFDWTSSNILLPLGGILIAVFAGWVLGRAKVADELKAHGGKIYLTGILMVILKFIAPLAISAVFLHGLGLL
ncbi:sodium-dependent transporter [Carboxylicivirga sediminis]|uniref:Transporter n=1 Tax=Carboxylicivirga sediminis TaxID=2006564 RepID=A0A941EYN8_9BACT|nr:sodium-dependent transporter [Carboxylicivirga sediminis]MBR8534168.1 sodium-dependent transporter [Carboxylicivirga sediminis]